MQMNERISREKVKEGVVHNKEEGYKRLVKLLNFYS